MALTIVMSNVVRLPELPKNHRLLLELIEKSGVGRHLTAADLFVAARKRQPQIGLATVHRALAALHSEGLIAKVEVPGNDAATYEPLSEPHAHFACRACNAIADVDFALPAGRVRAVAEALGAAVDAGHVTFSGLCRDCR